MAAQLLLHLGLRAHGETRAAGLTPTQWTALRYFGGANRVSRTASAFASFHCTTRGTASQTIKSLIAGGYLTRTRSERDGRGARLDPTPKGRAVLGEDPFQALVAAIERLPPGPAAGFGKVLERLAIELSWVRAGPNFGGCERCRHLARDITGGGETRPYYCLSAGEELGADEVGLLCVVFEPAARSRRC